MTEEKDAVICVFCGKPHVRTTFKVGNTEIASIACDYIPRGRMFIGNFENGIMVNNIDLEE